jgi:hypothetical protein
VVGRRGIGRDHVLQCPCPQATCDVCHAEAAKRTSNTSSPSQPNAGVASPFQHVRAVQ